MTDEMDDIEELRRRIHILENVLAGYFGDEEYINRIDRSTYNILKVHGELNEQTWKEFEADTKKVRRSE